MNRRRRETAYTIFYDDYKMLEKMGYIKDVMGSCKTKSQLDNAYNWGLKVIWGLFDKMTRQYCNKFDTIKWIDICEYWMKRMKLICEELKDKYNEMSGKVCLK